MNRAIFLDTGVLLEYFSVKKLGGGPFSYFLEQFLRDVKEFREKHQISLKITLSVLEEFNEVVENLCNIIEDMLNVLRNELRKENISYLSRGTVHRVYDLAFDAYTKTARKYQIRKDIFGVKIMGLRSVLYLILLPLRRIINMGKMKISEHFNEVLESVDTFKVRAGEAFSDLVSEYGVEVVEIQPRQEIINFSEELLGVGLKNERAARDAYHIAGMLSYMFERNEWSCFTTFDSKDILSKPYREAYLLFYHPSVCVPLFIIDTDYRKSKPIQWYRERRPSETNILLRKMAASIYQAYNVEILDRSSFENLLPEYLTKR